MSKEKRKREKVPCTEEMFEETRKVCEEYAESMGRLEENRMLLEQNVERSKKAESDLEKTAYDQEIARLQSQIQTDDENTSYFRWALAHLDEREQTVLTQLYIDGYTWDSVLSESGQEMSAGAINSARKRGIRKMSVLIADMKKMMSESFVASVSSNPSGSSDSSGSSNPSGSSDSSGSSNPSGSSDSSDSSGRA